VFIKNKNTKLFQVYYRSLKGIRRVRILQHRYLAVRFAEPFVHFPYELRAGRAHEFADVEQVEYVVGGQHLRALADGRRARLEFGEHGAGRGRRRRQTAAPPEVRPTYFGRGCSVRATARNGLTPTAAATATAPVVVAHQPNGCDGLEQIK